MKQLAGHRLDLKLVTKLYDIYQMLIRNFQYFQTDKMNLLLLSWNQSNGENLNKNLYLLFF